MEPATSMELLPAREIVQVVDENGRFREALAATLHEWGFDRMGFDYFVLAVLGVQSSGKSTLLNMLFGTRFDVMDAQRGRSQTTLGVWLGHTGTTQRHMLVFDVEGTDSKERGEEHGAFERKTSLLSLALSEVLLINMWTNDVGRFEGANYGLLKIVFEMNLRLFQGGGASKTLLLFVFRDHVPEQTSVEKLAETIRSDMVKIWEGMTKPDKFAHSRIDDFFDFRFVGLPHKVYQQALFADAVSDLQRQFLDQSHAEYVLDQRYKTDVPADGFARYAEKIWETIQEEKDLNLPSQKQMLALFRCEEIAKGVFEIFRGACEAAWGERIASGQSVRHFGKEATAAINAALSNYDSEATRYDKDVQASKRDDLLARMDAHLRPTYHALLKALVSASRERFAKLVRTDLPDGVLVRDFIHVASEIEATTLSHFDDLAAEATVPLFSTWSCKAERDELVHYIKAKLEEERELQLRNFAEQAQKSLLLVLRSRLAKPFDRSAEDLWSVVAAEFQRAREAAAREFEVVLGEFNCPPEEVNDRMQTFNEGTHATLRGVVEERVKNLDLLMAKRFKDSFELSPGGVPRQWSPKDDVSAMWVSAKLYAEALVDLYAVIRLDGEDVHVFVLPDGATEYVSLDDAVNVSPDRLVITPSEGDRLLEKFRDYAIPPYHAACKEQERAASQRTIPTYFLILLFVLGFNELMWVLNAIIWNPFLLLFVLLLAGGAFVVWKLNLSPLLVAGLASLLRHTDATVREKVVDLIHGPLSAVSPSADAALRRMSNPPPRAGPDPIKRVDPLAASKDSVTSEGESALDSPAQLGKAKAD